MAKKVASARFHSSIWIPGLADLGDTLPSKNKTLVGLKMLFGTVDGIDGLHVETRSIKFTVPSTNCKYVVYEPGESLIPSEDNK